MGIATPRTKEYLQNVVPPWIERVGRLWYKKSGSDKQGFVIYYKTYSSDDNDSGSENWQNCNDALARSNWIIGRHTNGHYSWYIDDGCNDGPDKLPKAWKHHHPTYSDHLDISELVIQNVSNQD